jgi:nucleotide-binding universal stress UspA family protein
MKTSEVRRILVALDASPHSDAALQEAAALAGPLHAELAGVFVLDNDLLRLSALPAASETGLTSAHRRALNPQSMERSLKLQASRARQMLEAVARSHRLEASFQLLQGNVLAEILKATKDTDLLAMGAVGQMSVTQQRIGSTVRGVTAAARCSVLLLSPGTRRGNAVVAVYGASTHAGRALELARQLASRRGVDLIVLIDAPQDTAASLEVAARAQLEKSDSAARFEAIGTGGLAALKMAVQRLDGGLLVMASDCRLIEGRQDELCSLEVPVLLARETGD